LPLFALSFVLFSLNVVLTSYFQSLERARQATLFMLLRGYLLVVPAFLLLPQLIGDAGLWLAVPLSELLTLMVILATMVADSVRRRRSVVV